MAASIASSKLLNLRNPALQILLRNHLLHPSAAAAASISPIPAQSLNSLHRENINPNWPNNSTAQSFHISNLPLHFQLPIEAARGYTPTPPDEFKDDEDEFGDDVFDFEDLSGSDFDDDYEDGDKDDDDDDDDEIRHPTRK